MFQEGALFLTCIIEFNSRLGHVDFQQNFLIFFSNSSFGFNFQIRCPISKIYILLEYLMFRYFFVPWSHVNIHSNVCKGTIL